MLKWRSWLERNVRLKSSMNLTIRALEPRDIQVIVSASSSAGVWQYKTRSLYERYLEEQNRGERVVLVAITDRAFAGYVTVKWQSDYAPFAEQRIPEIKDLDVLPAFRRRGIASALLDRAEALVSERSRTVGIGFGMYRDYGPAQRMYVLRGYVPDGRGLFHGDQPVVPGREVPVDDDLALYLTKELREGA
jgi:GNAT superfamily N-acetyltransferase